MSTQIFTGYLAVMLFFSGSIYFADRQYHCNPCESGAAGFSLTNKAAEEDYTNVFLYYPLEHSASGFSVYLNRKHIGKLMSGGRIECLLLLEGPVAITIMEGNAYREPLTQSRNSRTISVKKGKSYYFRVNGAGELEYMFNAAKGAKGFAETKDFVSRPVAFTETTEASIPALGTVTN